MLTERVPLLACPSEELLAAFGLGRLDDAERSALELHLDVCEACQDLAALAARMQPSGVVSEPRHETDSERDFNTTFSRGMLVGRRYLIERFIARGGMGEVYAAFDRDLGEHVALKTVASTASDDARAARRLKAEVQLARRVSHPNVCRIYDLGTHVLPGACGELRFLTMQYIEGETLGQRVRLAGALPFAEAAELTRELLSALRAAHVAGVLHRDFKSDNVMLKRSDTQRSTAVVLDFGLARGLEREVAPSGSSPNVVGTVGYIAPEQFEGEPYSIASDLYSFGVVWYEMLTGQMPFGVSSGTRVMPLRVPGAVPAPSSLNPEVPRALDAVVARCLERAPERRFASVDALLAAIDDALDGPRLRKRRTEFASALVAAGVVAAIVGAFAHDATGAKPARTMAVVGQTLNARPGADTAPAAVGIDAPAESTVPSALRIAGAPHAPSRSKLAALHATTKHARSRTGDPAPTPASTSTPAVASAAAAAAVVTSVPADDAPSPSRAEAPFPVGAPVHPKKPDWENPFGAVEPHAFAAGSRTPT